MEMYNNYNQITEVLYAYECLGNFNGIVETLALADEDVWEQIKSNKSSFCFDVQRGIDYFKEPTPMISKVVVVKDITRKQMRQAAEREREAFLREFENEWLEYKKTLPARTLTEIDTQNDNAFQQISIIKDKLNGYFQRHQNKKRDALENQLAELENEYNRTNKEIQHQDELYYQSKMSEFYQIKLREL